MSFGTGMKSASRRRIWRRKPRRSGRQGGFYANRGFERLICLFGVLEHPVLRHGAICRDAKVLHDDWMAHEKLKAAALFLAVLAVVGCVCWVVMTVSLGHLHPHVTQPAVSLIVHSVCTAFVGFG